MKIRVRAGGDHVADGVGVVVRTSAARGRVAVGVRACTDENVALSASLTFKSPTASVGHSCSSSRIPLRCSRWLPGGAYTFIKNRSPSSVVNW